MSDPFGDPFSEQDVQVRTSSPSVIAAPDDLAEVSSAEPSAPAELYDHDNDSHYSHDSHDNEPEEIRRYSAARVDPVPDAKAGPSYSSLSSVASSRPESKAHYQSRYDVAVTDPENKGEGMKQYTSYKVVCTSSDSGKISTVFRRFSDFSWLYTQLCTKYKGYIVPPLPEKAILGRLGGDFIQERRRALENFLIRVAAHPVLSGAEDVDLFLNGDDAALTRARAGKASPDASSSASSSSAAPKTAKKSVMGFFSNSVQTLSQSLGSKHERPKTETDIQCEKITAYIEGLETHLNKVHDTTESLLKNVKSQSSHWSELAQAALALSEFENGEGESVLGGAFGELSTCADRMAVLMSAKADVDQVNFREILKDYVRLVGAVKRMMKDRHAALVAYQNAHATLESRQTALAKVQGQSGKDNKVQAAEKAVSEAQVVVDEAQRALTQITESTLAEAAQFRADKQAQLKRVVVDFIKAQIEHCRKTQNSWESILQAIEQGH